MDGGDINILLIGAKKNNINKLMYLRLYSILTQINVLNLARANHYAKIFSKQETGKW